MICEQNNLYSLTSITSIENSLTIPNFFDKNCLFSRFSRLYNFSIHLVYATTLLKLVLWKPMVMKGSRQSLMFTDLLLNHIQAENTNEH